MSIFGKGSEANFLLKINGVNELTEVVNFEAFEELSEPFMVKITLASEHALDFGKIIEQEALLTIKGNLTDRYFHGIVRKFEHTGKTGSKYRYTAEIVPSCQLLSLEQDCRIFQNKNVQEIIADIFKDSNILSDQYEFRLKDKEHKRRFCVQYRETDEDFVTRLLQEEGIFYFYEHSKDKHLMVFADDPVYFNPIEGDDTIIFKAPSGLVPEKEAIFNINFSDQICTGTYTQTSHNFKQPSVPLEMKEQSKNESIRKYEIYDYPGQYGYDDRGKKLTKNHLEAQTALKDQATGKSNSPRLIAGHTFKLDGHNDRSFNKEYLLVRVEHTGKQDQTLEEHASGGTSYSNKFLVIPSDVYYRPVKVIKKPYINGVQSAIVTGPANEEIYVDEYGRVKVQFHWDRVGKKNEQSSCWLRCGQTWGGGGWGSVFIPRVGDEVLISFVNGDPDWPVITGSAYNAANPPLYDLPANKTRSTIKTKSYPNSNGFNELRFEDKAGDEEVYLQGEKDWNILIKNDKGQKIGHDERLDVTNNRTKTVGVDQKETIGVNKTIHVGVDHNETIGSDMTRKIGAFKTDYTTINSAETIGVAKFLTIGGLYQVSVGGIMNESVGAAKTEEVIGIKTVLVGVHMMENVIGNRTSDTNKTHTVKANKISVMAQTEISFTTGSASIFMKSGGDISIKGANLNVNGSGDVTIKGQKTTAN